MRKKNLFWASVLILGGVILFLNNLRIISVGWDIILPVFLILLGLWIVTGILFGKGQPASKTLHIPADGSTNARVKLSHGAGKLNVYGDDSLEEILTGEFTGGVTDVVSQTGNSKNIHLRMPEMDWIFPGNWSSSGLNWNIALNATTVYDLEIEGGASENKINLEKMLVSDLKLSTGASSTALTLPARGNTNAKISSGVASVEITIPSGVEAKIKVEAGLSGIDVAERFHKQGNMYVSSNYETAENKVILSIESGMGSISIY